jgi:carbon storage regulator CsrA
MGMLVLSRKKDEVVQITVPPSAVAQVIKVMVVEVRPDKTRIGFEADRSVIIHREEIQRIVELERQPVGVVRIGQPLPGELKTEVQSCPQ